MYAIVEQGGRQWKVKPGQVLIVDRMDGDVGTTLVLDKILFVKSDESAAPVVGSPYVAQARLEAEILEHSRGDKITTVKYRRRKGYRRVIGHRQDQTKLFITKISDGQGHEVSFESGSKKDTLIRASIVKAAQSLSEKTSPRKAAQTSAQKQEKAPTAKKKTATAKTDATTGKKTQRSSASTKKASV